MLKNCPEKEGEMKELITVVLENLKVTATFVNMKKSEAEKKQKVQQLDKQNQVFYPKHFHLLQPNRILMKEGFLTVTDENSNSASIYFFLFNDLLAQKKTSKIIFNFFTYFYLFLFIFIYFYLFLFIFIYFIYF